MRIEVDLHEVAIWVGAEVVGERFGDELPHNPNLISLHAIVQLPAGEV